LHGCSKSPKHRLTLKLFSLKNLSLEFTSKNYFLFHLTCSLLEHISEGSIVSIYGVEESVHFNKMHAYKLHDTLTSTVTPLTFSNLSDHLGFSNHILVLKFITICGRHQFIKTLLKKSLKKLIGIVG